MLLRRCDLFAETNAWPRELLQVHRHYPQITEHEWRGEHIEQCLNYMLIRPGAHVLEIGANIGHSTIVFAHHATIVSN